MTVQEIIVKAKQKTYEEISLIINLLIDTLDDDMPDGDLEPEDDYCDAYEDLGTKHCEPWQNVGFSG